jgi:hypothetical protein
VPDFGEAADRLDVGRLGDLARGGDDAVGDGAMGMRRASMTSR